ncbi:beta-xylosidase [Paraburkholderia fungorum]|uniref:Beta-xylosidase n=2 Tax=Paraburkholderia fungorum TaxID=134537 RepID=A0AAW3USA1_9BURK|nr:beta-xylosidase [Paraburkholderia fungorum]MBB4512651.1 hypothetical protein [Paraburkholderia fungorum]MBB5539750.1 hypothetical protein [Paraburkholderia fungorum]MBB6200556.1 hypothetical protein [Paraburkholderia fungorum]
MLNRSLTVLLQLLEFCAPMSDRLVAPSSNRTFYFANEGLNILRTGLIASRLALSASLLSGVALLAFSPAGYAQITQGSGSEQQENRTSPMGSTPDPAASAVHESNKPQAKENSGSPKVRGKTAGNANGNGHKPSGAGGFENGLYGTGAGSNK